MNYIYELLVFLIVFIIYLHITFHLKTNSNEEMFELNDPTKEEFERICDIRQPVIFTWDEPCSKIVDLLIGENEIKPHVYSLIKMQSYSLLQPPMCISYSFELINNVKATPLKYDLDYRNYFTVISGGASVRLIAPKNIEQLRIKPDYSNLEFISSVDVWTEEEQEKEKEKEEKEKRSDIFIEYTFKENETIYIPAYWAYSIKLIDDKSSVLGWHYKTYMNCLSLAPQYAMCCLQKLNTTYTF